MEIKINCILTMKINPTGCSYCNLYISLWTQGHPCNWELETCMFDIKIPVFKAKIFNIKITIGCTESSSSVLRMQTCIISQTIWPGQAPADVSLEHSPACGAETECITLANIYSCCKLDVKICICCKLSSISQNVIFHFYTGVLKIKFSFVFSAIVKQHALVLQTANPIQSLSFLLLPIIIIIGLPHCNFRPVHLIVINNVLMIGFDLWP